MQSAIDFERVRRENYRLFGYLLPHLPADLLWRMHGEALDALAVLPSPNARHFSCVATDLTQAKPVYTPHGDAGSAPTSSPGTVPNLPIENSIKCQSNQQKVPDRSEPDAQKWQQQTKQQLRPIRIRELSIGRVHVGRVLCARVCAPPIAVNSVQLLLEDCAGDAVRTSIYNVPTLLSAGDVLEPGTRLLVREPFYKLSADGLPTLRIDSPTDLVIDHTLEYVRQPQRTLEHLKQEGNEAFRQERFEEALFLYEQALFLAQQKNFATDCFEDTNATRSKPTVAPDRRLLAVLHSNAAECHLRRARFDAAVEEAKMALEIDPHYDRARTRYARALLHSGELKSARVEIELLEDTASKAELEAILHKFERQSRGEFDWPALISSWVESLSNSWKAGKAVKSGRNKDSGNDLRELGSDRPSPLVYEVIDYTSPKVDVARSRLGGLGIIAKAPLAAGELICVSRPLAYVWGALQSRPTERTVESIVSTFGLGSGERYGGPPPPAPEIALHARLLTGCVRDSRLRRTLHELFDGTDTGTNDGSENSVVRAEDRAARAEREISVERISRIVKYNKFGSSDGFGSSFATPSFELLVRQLCARGMSRSRVFDLLMQSTLAGVGVWHFPSFLNHSCAPNAVHFHLDSLFVIRALRPIAAGEEVLHPYISLEAPFSDRQANLAIRDIVCNCVQCVSDRSEESKSKQSDEHESSEFDALFEASQNIAVDNKTNNAPRSKFHVETGTSSAKEVGSPPAQTSTLMELTSQMEALYESANASERLRMSAKLGANLLRLGHWERYASIMYSALESTLHIRLGPDDARAALALIEGPTDTLNGGQQQVFNSRMSANDVVAAMYAGSGAHVGALLRAQLDVARALGANDRRAERLRELGVQLLSRFLKFRCEEQKQDSWRRRSTVDNSTAHPCRLKSTSLFTVSTLTSTLEQLMEFYSHICTVHAETFP